MKRWMTLMLLLPLLLTGCGNMSGTNHGEGSTSAGQGALSPEVQIALDAAQTKLDYYEELLLAMEAELLNVKTEWYIEKSAYEKQLEELRAQLEAAGNSPTPPVGNGSQGEQNALPFTYERVDGGIKILSYTGNEHVVQIPATIEGLAVVAIGDSAFQNQTQLQAVALPDGVMSIGWFAFAGCVSLERILLPPSVERIAYGAFENCPANMTVYAVRDTYAAAYAQSYGMLIQY